jgi:hypothetical protein
MKYIFTALLLCVAINLVAQWTSNGSNIYNTNAGNVGIGTNNPTSWFGGKVLEVATNRPVLKLMSDASTNLSTIHLTNSAVNATTHLGEFHINHSFNPTNSGQSSLRFGSYPGGDVMVLFATGNVGIGNTNPADKLSVGGNISFNLGNSIGFGISDKFTYDGKNVGNYALGWYNDSGNPGAPTGYLSSYGGFKIFTQGLPKVVISEAGNVGIGTVSPDAKLAVKGTIHSQEVKVDLQGAVAPDYVFEKDYNLRPLSDVESYIRMNKHLPEIPSAKQMEEEGLHLKEMNLLLLKKVEELTLYVIQLKEEIEQQQKEIESLKKK